MIEPILLLVVLAVVALSWWGARKRVDIYPHEVGLLFRSGQFVEQLEPGLHRFFDPAGTIRVRRVPMLPQAGAATQLEVISKDRFAFRLTLTPLITVVDARAFIEGTREVEMPKMQMAIPAVAMPRHYERLHAVLADAALAAVGDCELETFLQNPAEALANVTTALAPELPGTQLDGIMVTAITLPPETRKMFTEIERARREGLAALERARAEQASLRALANAARNLAGNPELARLRMLQVMESARGSKTFVLGDVEPQPGAAKGG